MIWYPAGIKKIESSTVVLGGGGGAASVVKPPGWLGFTLH